MDALLPYKEAAREGGFFGLFMGVIRNNRN